MAPHLAFIAATSQKFSCYHLVWAQTPKCMVSLAQWASDRQNASSRTCLAGGKNIRARQSPTCGKRVRRNLWTLTIVYHSIDAGCIYMLGSSHIYFQSVIITQNFLFLLLIILTLGSFISFAPPEKYCATSRIYCHQQYILQLIHSSLTYKALQGPLRMDGFIWMEAITKTAHKTSDCNESLVQAWAAWKCCHLEYVLS
jgi:hypothetical protein